MTDIKPRIVDGEPKCDIKCPSFEFGCCKHVDDGTGFRDVHRYCIPALRQQRDEAIVDASMATEESTRGFERGPFVTAREFCANRYGPAVAARLFPESKP